MNNEFEMIENINSFRDINDTIILTNLEVELSNEIIKQKKIIKEILDGVIEEEEVENEQSGV